ncbi:MAG: DUF4347 domain-containing protein, partial [Miltoncostaeaceae bacterium]
MKQSPPKGDRRRPILLELERRILLSADAAALGIDHDDAADPRLPEPAAHVELLDAEGVASQQEVAKRHELVIVDAGVADADQLVADLLASAAAGEGLEVLLLDAGRDGITQITELLAGRDDLDAVHIVSHGSEGAVQLGSGWLDADALEAQAGALATWGDALALDGDLLFYGCDLAASASGQALVDSLADLTGADVAASDDRTGAAALGGDWDLEYAAGRIEAEVAVSAAAQENYSSVLAVPVINDRETVDSDGDGEIDQIRITTDQNLNDNFGDLSIAVSGYEVTGYSTGTTPAEDNDNIFYVNLTESGTNDTDATPNIAVVANTLLTDNGGTDALAPDAGLIVFEKGGDIYTMTPDGSNETLIFDDATHGLGEPSWSPDMSKILYVR